MPAVANADEATDRPALTIRARQAVHGAATRGKGDDTLASAFQQEQAVGPLVLADITGYTAFLQDVAYAHRDNAFANGQVPAAYALMSKLLDGIVARLAPPLTLAKLEGDAVFAYAPSMTDIPQGKAFLDLVRDCYSGFRAQLGEVGVVWTCQCDACSRSAGLELKFVVHGGPFVIGTMAGGRELIGPEVIMAHRLLKSSAADAVGVGAYILVTDSAQEMLQVGPSDAPTITETYEHYPPVRASVVALP